MRFQNALTPNKIVKLSTKKSISLNDLRWRADRHYKLGKNTDHITSTSSISACVHTNTTIQNLKKNLALLVGNKIPC